MSNHSHLYEIDDEILNVLKLDSDEIINEKELDFLFLKFHDKIQACLGALKNLKGILEMVTAERKRLQGKEYTLSNKIRNLEQFVMGEMIRTENTSLDYGTHKAIVSNSPLSVEVNMNVLPEEWHKPIEPEEPKPNKEAILKHYRETEEEVPGTTIVRGKHLRVTR